jgi:hypothetical protein
LHRSGVPARLLWEEIVWSTPNTPIDCLTADSALIGPKPNPEYHTTIAPSSAAATARFVDLRWWCYAHQPQAMKSWDDRNRSTISKVQKRHAFIGIEFMRLSLCPNTAALPLPSDNYTVAPGRTDADGSLAAADRQTRDRERQPEASFAHHAGPALRTCLGKVTKWQPALCTFLTGPRFGAD